MVKAFVNQETDKEFSANTYVLGKIGGSCLIIDLGTRNESLLSYVKKHYERCVGILLTHAHFDHIRGVNAFLRNFPGKSIPVFLHPEDKCLIDSPELNASYMTGEKVRGNFETTDIQDGEFLPIKDFHIQVIHTPFHTMGSVCFLSSDDNALFTGDTLFKGSIGRADLPNVSDPTKVSSSLKKLMVLRDTLVVYPGHGPMSNLGSEKKTNPYLVNLQ